MEISNQQEGVVRNLALPAERWVVVSAPRFIGESMQEETDAVQQASEEIIPRPDNRRLFLKIYWADDLSPEWHLIGHLFAAYALQIPILSGVKDPERWMASDPDGETLTAFSKRPIQIEVKEGDLIGEGTFHTFRVVLCNRYWLSVDGYGTAEVRRHGFINNVFWIVTDCRDPFPLRQAAYYLTEEGDLDDSYDEDLEEFTAEVAMIKKDYASLMTHLLGPYLERLRGLNLLLDFEGEQIRVKEVDRNTK